MFQKFDCDEESDSFGGFVHDAGRYAGQNYQFSRGDTFFVSLNASDFDPTLAPPYIGCAYVSHVIEH